jgi:hypothetical protein
MSRRPVISEHCNRTTKENNMKNNIDLRRVTVRLSAEEHKWIKKHCIDLDISLQEFFLNALEKARSKK